MQPRRVTLVETRDGLQYTFVFTYEEKLPNAPERRESLASYLEGCARRIREGEAVDIGQAENTRETTKWYRDDVLIEKER